MLVKVTETAVSFYLDRLRKAPDAADARRYLRGRDYDAEVVARFRLGYSPDGGDVLVRHLQRPVQGRHPEDSDQESRPYRCRRHNQPATG